MITSGITDLVGEEERWGAYHCLLKYWALNSAMIKNQYPWLIIAEMLDRLCRGHIFTKLDRWNVYHLIRINWGDEYETAFCTQYSLFEYLGVTIGLTNPPATFQCYIDDCLWAYINDFAMCHLEKFIIDSTDEKNHNQRVRKVLEWQREFGFCCQAKKC